MKGVVLTGHGGPDKLQWREDLPTPEPGCGEVRLRVLAAAVNNTDINTRLAWYSKGDGDASDATWTGKPLEFPHIQGIDACGVIDAVGEGVDPARIGKRVLVEPCLTEAAGAPLDPPWFLGSECPGAFAEYLTVASRHAHAIDSDLSDLELATFPCSYSTAENLLCRAGASGADRVLVTGASGGVGSAAVQLLRARGAEVVAISQPAKAEALRALGAAEVVDRQTDLPAQFGKGAFDMVVDLVGGPGFADRLEVLRSGGRYATSGAVAGAEVALDLRTLYLRDLSLFGATVLGEGVFASLIRRIEAGEIAPLLAAQFPLEKIHAAQEAFSAGDHIGKIGLRVAADASAP